MPTRRKIPLKAVPLLHNKMDIKTENNEVSTGQTHNSPDENFVEIPSPKEGQIPNESKAAIAHSVIVNWIGHIVFILGGFILPRLINDHLGQEQLGVWDFGWSTVAYLNLLTAGIASAVNRYVAKYKASSQWVAMSNAVSCCAGIFTGSAIIGVTITFVLIYVLPWISPPAFLTYLSEMQILLFCLGLSVSIDLFLPTYVGIISGWQRYDLLVFIETGCHLILLVVVVLILALGGGLSWLGIPILSMRIIEGILKRMVARRLCPLLRISPGLITWQGLRTVFTFGGKTLMETLAKIGLYQGNSMLIAYFLGPAPLAIYARSMALILHTNKLLFQFGRVFAPSASHLKSVGDIKALRTLVLNSARSGCYIALPMALVLGVLGDSLLRIWMGPGYAELSILPILAVGHLFAQSQAGTFYILMGTNRHGMASLTILACSMLSLLATIFLVKYYRLGLFGVGLSVSLAVALPYLTIIPFLAARTISTPFLRYLITTTTKPFLLCLPTAFCLIAARQWAGPNDYQILGSGLGAGGLILAFMYWRWALPSTMKKTIMKKILHRQV